MSPRELLIKEIEQMPDAIVQALLDFLMLLKPSVHRESSVEVAAKAAKNEEFLTRTGNPDAAPGQSLVDLFLSAPKGEEELCILRHEMF